GWAHRLRQGRARLARGRPREAGEDRLQLEQLEIVLTHAPSVRSRPRATARPFPGSADAGRRRLVRSGNPLPGRRPLGALAGSARNGEVHRCERALPGAREGHEAELAVRPTTEPEMLDRIIEDERVSGQAGEAPVAGPDHVTGGVRALV